MFMLHLCIGKACNCVRGETGSVSKRMMPPTFEEMLTLASESLSLVFRGVGVVVVLAALGVDFLAGPTSPRLGRVNARKVSAHIGPYENRESHRSHFFSESIHI